MRVRPIVIALVLAATAGMAQAQDAIAGRQALMKSTGRAFGEINRMNRGQDPYDGAKAAAAFGTISANLEKFGGLFPEDSKSGDTEASPAIWENKADFEARVTKLATDAKAAAAASGQGEAEFKTAFQTIAPQCAGCHQNYRTK